MRAFLPVDCVEVSRPSKPISGGGGVWGMGVMLSAVSLTNHTLLVRLIPLSG